MGLTLKGSAVLVWSLGLHPVGHLINTSGKMRAQVYVVSSVEPVRLQAVAFWTSRDVQHHWLYRTSREGLFIIGVVKGHRVCKVLPEKQTKNKKGSEIEPCVVSSAPRDFRLQFNDVYVVQKYWIFFHLRQRLESKSGDLCVAFKTFLFYLFITLSLKMFPLSLGLCEDSSFINLIIRIIFIGRTCTYTPT